MKTPGVIHRLESGAGQRTACVENIRSYKRDIPHLSTQPKTVEQMYIIHYIITP